MNELDKDRKVVMPTLKEAMEYANGLKDVHDCFADRAAIVLCQEVIDRGKETWNLGTEVEELKEELKELKDWKESAIAVENEWDAQKIGELLNIPIGHTIRANIEAKVRELIEQKNELKRLALRMVEIFDDSGDEITAKQFRRSINAAVEGNKETKDSDALLSFNYEDVDYKEETKHAYSRAELIEEISTWLQDHYSEISKDNVEAYKQFYYDQGLLTAFVCEFFREH